MEKMLYKCCLCGVKLPDRTKMRRMLIQKWEVKGYGQFRNDKHHDFCNRCYLELINKMKEIRNERKI